MSVIWKYDLKVTDEQVLDLPEGAQILSVQQQAGSLLAGSPLQLWALVDPDNAWERRFFHVVGTGNSMPILSRGECLTHLATVVTVRGALVWHVFEQAQKKASDELGRN